MTDTDTDSDTIAAQTSPRRADKLRPSIDEKIIGTDDLQHVERYDGTLGVTREFVRRFAPATVRLRFNTDLSHLNRPGRVAGASYGSGVLIAPNLVLTAGHVLRPGPGWVFPRDNDTGQVIGPAQVAQIMHCQFGYQEDPGGTLRAPTNVPVVEMVDVDPGGLDVALLRLEGTPGEQFGWLEPSERAPVAGEPIAVIQHPSGKPKMIEAGTVDIVARDEIGYVTIDTEGGSSGSGVLDRLGRVVAVHVRGVDADGTITNHAVPVASALRESPTIREAVARGRRLDIGGDGPVHVTWADDPDRNGFANVAVATLNSSGAITADSRAWNPEGAGQQLVPRVAGVGSEAALVWEDDPDGNDFYNLTVAGTDEDHRFIWGPAIAHRNGSGQQLGPDIAMDAAGNIAVVWQDDADQNGFFNVHGRGFDRTGHERIREFIVHAAGAGDQLNPVVAMSRAGSFVVAWEDDRDRDGLRSIYARRFRANGSAIGGDMFVSSERTSGQQMSPAVSVSPSGRYAGVAWEDDADLNSFFNVRFRVFRVDDGRETIDEQIAHVQGAGQQRRPAIVVRNDGSVVLAWEDDPDRNGFTNVSVRGIRPDGTESFPAAQPHRVGDGNQRNPSLTLLSDNTVVVAIEEDRDTDGWYRPIVCGIGVDGTIRWNTKL